MENIYYNSFIGAFKSNRIIILQDIILAWLGLVFFVSFSTLSTEIYSVQY